MCIQEDPVGALLQQAGLTQAIESISPLASNGSTNQMTLITLVGGARLVLRQYRWPWETPDLDRPHKEQYLHALLRQAGVPVPTILAHSNRSGQSFVLIE